MRCGFYANQAREPAKAKRFAMMTMMMAMMVKKMMMRMVMVIVAPSP